MKHKHSRDCWDRQTWCLDMHGYASYVRKFARINRATRSYTELHGATRSYDLTISDDWEVWEAYWCKIENWLWNLSIFSVFSVTISFSFAWSTNLGVSWWNGNSKRAFRGFQMVSGHFRPPIFSDPFSDPLATFGSFSNSSFFLEGQLSPKTLVASASPSSSFDTACSKRLQVSWQMPHDRMIAWSPNRACLILSLPFSTIICHILPISYVSLACPEAKRERRSLSSKTEDTAEQRLTQDLPKHDIIFPSLEHFLNGMETAIVALLTETRLTLRLILLL